MTTLTPASPSVEELIVRAPVLPPVAYGIERAACVRVSVPLPDPTKRDEVLRRFQSLVVFVNQIAALTDRSRMMISADHSGTRDGEQVLTLIPCDAEGALETCKRVAHLLWGAQVGSAVRVYDAEKPEAPVFEIAA
jgi:hypothetical protein